MPPVLRVDSLGKRYRVGRAGPAGRFGYRTLRDDLVRLAGSPFRWLRRGDGPGDDFWALRDVDFEVQPGEVVGIIGRNGAGKSTLLKILSRITRPTTGRAVIRGRVGSLLEVGTGFHPELTGRENVFLNGAILGMSRREIADKFDAIVEFSGTERFLDTPVKRYSSGMYVRLAFAVSAHLEPEVLIVDEVLAVGDLEFQRKCFGKMGEVARSGRTVLLVSHQLPSIEALCTRALVLSEGTVSYDGATGEGVEHFLALTRNAASDGGCDLESRRTGSGEARFTSLRLLDPSGRPTDAVGCGEGVCVEFEVTSRGELHDLQYRLVVSSARGQRLFRVFTGDLTSPTPTVNGRLTVRCELGPLNLMPGVYHLSPTILRGRDYQSPVDEVPEALSLHVIPRDVLGTGHVPGSPQDVVFVPCAWRFDAAAAGADAPPPATRNGCAT